MENRNEELIERFIAGDLTPEEIAELQQRLGTDPALKAELDWQKQVAGAWQKLENRRLKSLLQGEEKAFRPAARTVSMRIRQWSAVAAVLVAVLAAVWFLRPAGAPDATDFFAAYPDKISYGRGESQSTLEAEAIGPYNNGNFSAAAAAFGRLQAAYPDSTIYAFYHGVALVGARQYAQAVPVLVPVSRQNRYQGFQTNALWYLSLAYTGAKNYAEARGVLKNYLDRPDAVTYRAEAERLLQHLPN